MSDIELKAKRSYPHGIRKVRVWGKGQFTIPAEIREHLGISEDTILEVFQIGKAIVATPENIKVKELAGSVQKDMEKNQIDIDALLAELREGSHSYETE
ncbi:hypothetical protein Psch_01457 [Pelotomaculum schinkii]|uniref:SpoVT-AbrB domain-containing protein n=1 Tax=Pelotomaculum schinkii TaxID=78350 RepID=A0A4Y7RGS2_9FIRM|nr:AbrB/MazE/SpoVT family DNA-binding domain-containing protein [Pelotomaculum schinkii]TEB07902.1 hypothetical protein Psch_01457 [Pelotomaculum schinkii]